MKKVIIVYILILVITALAVFFLLRGKEEPQVVEVEEEIIRQPAVAGQFYPANSQELADQIDGFLNEAILPEAEGEIFALVLPHAGYQFSGQVAAFGFKNLINESVDTVILIGNSHTERFDGISVFPEGFYETPLGKVKIDTDLAKKIIEENGRIFFRESAHQKEHSIEVELPFLQKTLKSFRIVPIIFGNTSNEDYKILAGAISKNIKDKNVLLIASSDLSHYPNYKDAEYADSKVIEAILTGEAEKLEKAIEDLEKEEIENAVTFACGRDAIKTIMLVAQDLGVEEIKLLNYANSGDVPIGDKNRVVGYTAIGFFTERRGDLLNKKEQEKLLEIAKITVETYIKEGKTPDFEIEDKMLNQKIGAFVTLKKDGRLRGCIGRYSPTDISLYQVVSQMAIAAATQDNRFLPVTEDELDKLYYEISVLSSLEKINDWREIELGKHGVQIRIGGRAGVFLPQVATDNNWDFETFMGQLCGQKVGLSLDCWQREDAELYVFTAQVFEEE